MGKFHCAAQKNYTASKIATKRLPFPSPPPLYRSISIQFYSLFQFTQSNTNYAVFIDVASQMDLTFEFNFSFQFTQSNTNYTDFQIIYLYLLYH